MVASVFKAAAFVVLALGLLGALITGLDLSSSSSLSTSSIVTTCIGIAGGVVLASASFAFFGYVLELLIDIRTNSEVVAQLALADEEESP